MEYRTILIFWSFFVSLGAFAGPKFARWEEVYVQPSLEVSRGELVTYDNMLQIFKIAQKGYASAYILEKGLKATRNISKYALFHEWLLELKRFPKLPLQELLKACLDIKNSLPQKSGINRLLTTQRLHSCRQITLQQLAPKVLSDGVIGADEAVFLSRNMQPFIHGKGQDDFIWFMQRLQNKPEPLSYASRIVTEYVVKTNRQVPRGLLPLLVITPELTKHVQNFGLDATTTRQVYQAEYSRLIDESYSAIDKAKTPEVLAKARAVGQWLRPNIDKLDRFAALGRYSDLGKNLWRNGHPEIAIEIFEMIMREKNAELRDDARFFRLWVWISKGDWKAARKWIDSQNLVDQFETIGDSRLRFWISYTMQQTEAPKVARKLFEDLIANHPLSFYSIMAVKSLQANHPDSLLCKFYINAVAPKAPTIKPADLSPELIERLHRLKAWARLDDKEFLKAELRGLRNDMFPRLVGASDTSDKSELLSDLWTLTGELVGQEGNFLESFRLIYSALEKKKLNFSRPLLEILYPRPYIEQLRKTMKDHPADPLLVLSLIRQESVFNPDARSRVGARGLMQLMPTTARRFKKGVGDKQLTTPSINLELGTRYFEQLHKRYSGNLVHVLAAYNAGESRVEKWKTSYFNSEEMLTNIENIPFLETRNYVKLIFRNLYFYKLLEAKTTDEDNPVFNRIHDVHLGFKR